MKMLGCVRAHESTFIKQLLLRREPVGTQSGQTLEKGYSTSPSPKQAFLLSLAKHKRSI